MDGSGGRKNGVDVGGEKDDRAGAVGGHVCRRQDAEDIGDSINLDVAETNLREALGEPFCASLLSMSGRGDCHDFELPIHDGFWIGVQPGEGSVNGPFCSEGSDARERRS